MLALTIIFWLFTAYFAFCALYVFGYAIAGLFYTNQKAVTAVQIRKIAVLIPAYKADNVIEELADNILLQNYPDYDVIIIADSVKEDVLQRLRQRPVKVMEFAHPNRTKALALNTIMAQLPDVYDIALILDADNMIVMPDYLQRINDFFESGRQVVQTHRTAKNTNTSLAMLDAISEEINNSLFRRGHVVLGLSSALIGSAMAFDYRLYKKQMQLVSSSGEDKELEMLLLKQHIHITYADNLVVLDEKTQKADAFVNQRARWISNQILQARRNALEGFRQLLRGNVDFFDKALQLFLLPRVLLLGSVTILTALALIFLPWAYSLVWLCLFFTTCLGLLLAIPRKFYTRKLLKAIVYLPLTIVLMILSMLKMKGATKTFVATEHASITDKYNTPNTQQK